MICRQCGDIVVLKSTIHGTHTICNTCSKVDFSDNEDYFNKKQDIKYSEDDLDNIADRGRD